MRVSAVVGLLLVVLFHGLRLAATQCTGGACDWYIPFSLLIPIAVLVMVAIAGLMALQSSVKTRAPRWTAALAITTALGVLGPPLALAVFKDAPDALVVTATMLWLVGLGGVLGYSAFLRARSA